MVLRLMPLPQLQWRQTTELNPTCQVKIVRTSVLPKKHYCHYVQPKSTGSRGVKKLVVVAAPEPGAIALRMLMINQPGISFAGGDFQQSTGDEPLDQSNCLPSTVSSETSLRSEEIHRKPLPGLACCICFAAIYLSQASHQTRMTGRYLNDLRKQPIRRQTRLPVGRVVGQR
jgi:hypothetical protein